VKPLDVELAVKLARGHDALVTVEENVVAGGAGSAVAEALAAAAWRYRCFTSDYPTAS
jgi:1-deoxy-D-xylulose-5-phosphate synthase